MTKFTFTDTAGREWVLPRITIGVKKRIQRELGIDLYGVVKDAATSAALFDDRDRMDRLLWLLCRDTADGMSEDDFFERLGPDQAGAAQDAVVWAVTDFLFPNPAQKEAALRVIRQKMAEMEANLSLITSGTSPSAPASSDATPTAGPSGN